MSEVTRFRIARAPISTNSESLNAFSYPTDQDASIFDCNLEQGALLELAQGYLKSKTYINDRIPIEFPCISTLNSRQPVLTHIEETKSYEQNDLLVLLAKFLSWLEDKAGEREPTACLVWLIANGGELLPASEESAAKEVIIDALIKSDDWKNLRVIVGDSLIAALASHFLSTHIDYLTRLFRALSIIEILGLESELPTPEAGLGAGAKFIQQSMRRFVIVPLWLQTLRENLLTPNQPLFARAPAFSDLIVVREEWSCYVPGEISHIENILKGELKERNHERMEEVETKQEEETTTTNYQEQDTQTTERHNLKEEASTETQLQIGVEGQVDTSGQYGPTHVETHLGAQLHYSVQESRRRASEESREIVNRAVSRVETRVREFRSRRALTRITEQNNHKIDNTQSPTGHITGIYRWVDKIMRLQTFRYKHRFLLEFEIPEPAAHYRWLHANPPAPSVNVEKPAAFVLDARSRTLLKPNDINRTNYQQLAGKFGANGVLPPPDPQITVAGVVTLSPEGRPDHRDDLIEFAPHKSGKIELTIPQNYQATAAHASVSGHPTLGRWRDQPDDSPDGYVGVFATDRPSNSLGYHSITAAFTLAGQKLQLPSVRPEVTVRGDVHLPPPHDVNRHLQYSDAWLVVDGDIPAPRRGNFGTGKLEIGVVVGGAFEVTASVSVLCELQQSAFEAWQLETYDRLKEAHRAADEAYREVVNAAEIRRDEGFEGRSPTRNAEIVREELKKQVIEMLFGHTFRGFELRESPADPDLGPLTNFREAIHKAPLIQFVEQAFEWNNLTYIMYPYYWAGSARSINPQNSHWIDLELIEGADPDFVRFLRSGSARVIVPARPGFEASVMHLATFGEVWLGGVPPIPGDPMYISVAQEVQEMNGAPDDGEPGDLWEVKLPTTLVWLDPNSDLPKNEHPHLQGQPLVDLCDNSA